MADATPDFAAKAREALTNPDFEGMDILPENSTDRILLGLTYAVLGVEQAIQDLVGLEREQWAAGS